MHVWDDNDGCLKGDAVIPIISENIVAVVDLISTLHLHYKVLEGIELGNSAESDILGSKNCQVSAMGISNKVP